MASVAPASREAVTGTPLRACPTGERHRPLLHSSLRRFAKRERALLPIPAMQRISRVDFDRTLIIMLNAIALPCAHCRSVVVLRTSRCVKF